MGPYGMNGPGQMSQGAKILDVIRQNDPKDPKVLDAIKANPVMTATLMQSNRGQNMQPNNMPFMNNPNMMNPSTMIQRTRTTMQGPSGPNITMPQSNMNMMQRGWPTNQMTNQRMPNNQPMNHMVNKGMNMQYRMPVNVPNNV